MTNQEENLDQMLSKLYDLLENIQKNMVTKAEFKKSKSDICTYIDKVIAEKTGTKLPT